MSKSVLDGIRIPGYTNRWSSIDEYKVGDKTYYLMENDTWGDETCGLVITPDFKEIYETFDDIETCLTDEGILTESINKSDLKEKYVNAEYFENKELAQVFEDIEEDLHDIRTVLNYIYDIPEEFVSIKNLKEASGHLYDAWSTLYKVFNDGMRKKKGNEEGSMAERVKIKIEAFVESVESEDYEI